MSLRFSCLCAIVSGAGCLAAAPEPDVQVSASSLGGGGGNCDEFMCGTNSPVIAQFGFWDLNVPSSLAAPGAANAAGLRLRAFVHGGGVYLPRVAAGRLYALPTTSAPPYNVALSGQALVGGYFLLQSGARQFEVTVDEVGSVDSWAQPAKTALESYKLDWAELFAGGVTRAGGNLCKNPPTKDNPDALGMVGATAFHTLLFEGDRIDAAKKLDTGVDRSWFNLGCAGSALAKLALTGHTQGAADAGTFVTTLAERQTMLKLLTADYCGDGTPFTVGGQYLNWADDRGTMGLLALAQGKPVKLEARWKELGPACLATPRVDAHPTAAAAAQFLQGALTVYDQVQAHCPQSLPPPCQDDDVHNLDGYHLLSATPL